MLEEKKYDKMAIRSYIQDLLKGKIKKLQYYLNFTIEASQDIHKTPKYDSLREEIQEEIYHLDRQMFNLKTMESKLKLVLNSKSEVPMLGSLIITNKARFYISISLGEFFFDNDRFYAISEESPMAMKMFGKKVGDHFMVNNIQQEIVQIF